MGEIFQEDEFNIDFSKQGKILDEAVWIDWDN